MMKNLSAVIVAGRENRHLKSPKQLLPFGETTVLDRTLSAYLDAGVTELILVLGHRGEEIAAALSNLDPRVKLVTSPHPDAGFGTHLQEGIQAISPNAKAFLLGLGDQPTLTAELVSRLAQQFEAGGKKILVPVCQGSIGHPAFFSASLLPEFKKLSSTQDAWDVIKANGAEVLDIHMYETCVVRDIEDFEDYKALLQIAGLPVPDTMPGSEAETQPAESLPQAFASAATNGTEGA